MPACPTYIIPSHTMTQSAFINRTLPIARKLVLPLLFFLTCQGLSAAGADATADYTWNGEKIKVELEFKRTVEETNEETKQKHKFNIYSVYKDKNPKLEDAHYFDQLEFSITDNQLKTYLSNAPGIGIYNDLTEHHIGQLVLFVSKNSKKVMPNINAEAMNRLSEAQNAGKASIRPFGDTLTIFANEITLSNAENKLGAFYRAFRSSVEGYINQQGGKTKVAYVVSHILGMHTVDEMAKILHEYQQLEIQRESSVASSNAIFKNVRENLLSLSFAIITILGVTVGLNYFFKLVYDWVYKQLFSNDVIVFTTLPQNPIEWVMQNIFGQRKKMVSNFHRMIHPPERMREMMARTNGDEACIKYNKKIGSARRAAGEGAPLSHNTTYGPPGGGKTMWNREQGVYLYDKDLVHLVFIDGADFGKLDSREIPDVINRIEKNAWEEYVRTGKTTLLLIDEFDMICPPRFAKTTSWQMRELVSKLLATFPSTNSCHLVLRCTTNLNLRPNSPERKSIDPAFLDRVGTVLLYMGRLSGKLLSRVREEAMVDYAKRRGGLKIMPEAFVPMREIEEAIMKESPTPRQQKGYADQIMSEIFANRLKGRKTKKRPISATEVEEVLRRRSAVQNIESEDGDYGEKTGYYSEDVD